LTTGDIYTGNDSAYKTICSMGCPDQSTDFDGTLQVKTNPGYIGTVEMIVEAGGAFSDDPNSGYAYVDPYFYIDPSTPDASAYSITLSDGVGNGLQGVPEPGAWALMLTGVGVAGAGLRRLRSRQVVA
jgi:hypothetical protein